MLIQGIPYTLYKTYWGYIYMQIQIVMAELIIGC